MDALPATATCSRALRGGAWTPRVLTIPKRKGLDAGLRLGLVRDTSLGGYAENPKPLRGHTSSGLRIGHYHGSDFVAISEPGSHVLPCVARYDIMNRGQVNAKDLRYVFRVRSV